MTTRATPTGTITTRAPRAPKRFKAAGPSALSAPDGGAEFGWNMGGAPAYRDASPSFLGGGNAFFTPSLTSSNREVLPNRDSAVTNARWADRNNPFINGGLSKRAVNTVGATLRLQYLPNWAALGIDETDPRTVAFVQAIENHFSLWGEDHALGCDAQRQGQFGALMLLAAREALGTEGETFIISRYDEDRQLAYSLKYATFIEVVTCDRLSTPDWYSAGRPGVAPIVAGKELDRYGAAVAYHVEIEHRDDSLMGVREWARIERESEWGRPIGIHFFFRSRAGQQRNMPAIIQSLRSVKMLDKFDDAELQAAVVNAILSIFIESEGTTEEVLTRLTQSAPSGGRNALAELWDKRFDFYENNELRADGVRIPVLPPGDKITMSTASRSNGDSKDFRSAYMRAQAATLNLTYEQFSGDYSETTFSSARAALIDVWRMITADRILFTQHVAYPCFVGFLEECYLRADELGIEWPEEWPDFYDNLTAWSQCEFRGPGMGWVDPTKDVTGAGLRVEQGLTSPTYEASQQGQDFRDNVDQTARDYAYARSKGVAIPGMPEYAAMQNPVAPPAEPDAPAGGPETEDDEQADQALNQEGRAQ